MLFDTVKIYTRAGDGGNGIVSFHREKYVAHGGPDGGDGGNGGNVILRIDEGANTLLYFKYRRKFVAENGENGKASKCHGATAGDLILPVPPGTVIKDPESGLVIHDMSDGQDYVLCRGGRGGWGNRHFATPTRQIPRFAKSGIKGQEREVLLELKMIADVGLIGLPNVGKSSILSMVSAARPKIADYNFTTLSPNLGVVKGDSEGSGFVMADIPGLIEGASEGAGLGHMFLRHVDRCRLLVHVVDISGMTGRDPVEDIKLINSELFSYSPSLAERPQMIVANKADVCGGEGIEELEKFVSENGWEMMTVSAATGQGLKELVREISRRLALLPPVKVYESEYTEPDPVDPGDRSVTVRNENGVYIVEGEWLYNLMGSVNFEDRESLNYFQRCLRKSGVIDAMTEAGVKDGDTVSIYDFEFEFVS